MKGASARNPCEIFCTFRNFGELNLYWRMDFLLSVERKNGILRLTTELNELLFCRFQRVNAWRESMALSEAWGWLL